MPLYQLTSKSNVQQVKPTSFQSEKQLQKLFEANLEKLLGVRFIASEFQRHFLLLGLKGGLIGGGAAALTFLAARALIARIATPANGESAGALLQSVSIGWSGYAGIAGIVALLALLAAFTSRLAVFRHLRSMD